MTINTLKVLIDIYGGDTPVVKVIGLKDLIKLDAQQRRDRLARNVIKQQMEEHEKI